LLFAVAAEGVRINEFMASNKSGLMDSFGEYSDWIEIYNDGNETVSLKDFGLSDDAEKPFKWRFPNTNLFAKSYLTVFATSDSFRVPGSELHCGFKLSADGEYLGLCDKEGRVLSSFAPTFPPQLEDTSYGWREDKFGDLVYMDQPTPGGKNRGGFKEIIGGVTTIPEPGFYEEPFELRLRCAAEGAKIVYTLDGTTPKKGGTIYRGHFTVNKTTIVRAIAYKDDAGGALEFTGTFVFLNDIINTPDGVPPGDQWPTNSVNKQRLDYGMDTRITQSLDYRDAMLPGLKQLPFLSIVVSPANLFNASSGIYVNAKQDGKLWERQAHIELLNHDGAPGFSVGCGLRIRGSSSRAANNPKHSFRLFFRREWGAGKLKFPLFGENEISEFDKIDLRSTQTFSWHFEGDAYQSAYCRDEFVRDLALSMGMPGTRGRYYHLLLNGHYWGLYQTEERPDQNYAAHYFGGSEDDYDVLKPEDLVVTVTHGNKDAFRKLWQAATNGFDDANYSRTVKSGLLDPTNVADMAILNSLVCNMDSPVAIDDQHVNNFFALYNREKPNGFKFINHDSECSLLRDHYDADLTKDTSVGSKLSYFNSRYLNQRLMKSGEYRKVFVSRVCKHYFNGGAAEPKRMQELFMKRADSITNAIVCESARWGDIRAPYGDRLPLRRDRDWQPNITYIRNKFLPHRYEVTLEQYRAAGWFPQLDPPILSLCGGTVPYGSEISLIGEKKIVYTLDGSDPWVSETAKIYLEPVALTNSLSFRCCYAKSEIDFPMRGEADFTVEELPEPCFGILLLLFLLGKRRTLNV